MGETGSTAELIIATLAGGGVAIISALVVALVAERRGRVEWRRQARLEVARKLVRAFQTVNRAVTNIAISEHTEIDGDGKKWEVLHTATIEWNSAQHEAALVSPTDELRIIGSLDAELDRVLEAAVSKRWDATAFRKERIKLGELLGQYIRVARMSASEGDIPLASGWHWASDEKEALRPPNQPEVN